MEQTELLTYFRNHGPMTDPRQHARLLDGLPKNAAKIVETVQGLLVHIFWANAYQLELNDERKSEVNIRPVWRKLSRILELEPSPLEKPRANARKLVGNCRDFTVLTVSLLRSAGIAARSRCGFGAYFIPNHFEDHWVLEYWHDADKRWVMVDAQMDELQQNALKLAFDPLDMPPGAFVTGGEAWLMARRGEADPDCFGIFEWHGMDFIKGNLLRDLLSFNKFEVLPWDFWGVLQKPAAEMSDAELAKLDQMAQVCQNADAAAAHDLYQSSPEYPAPLEWAD